MDCGRVHGEWLAGLGREEIREEHIRGGMLVEGQCYRIDTIWYKE